MFTKFQKVALKIKINSFIINNSMAHGKEKHGEIVKIYIQGINQPEK